jgi:hypothetical protein
MDCVYQARTSSTLFIEQVTYDVRMGLWKAGNTLAGKVASLLQNGDAYNASLNGRVNDFPLNKDYSWIKHNAPQVLSGPRAYPAHARTHERLQHASHLV